MIRLASPGPIVLVMLCFLAHPVALSGQDPGTVSYSIVIDCSHGAIRNEGTRATYTIIGVSEAGESVPFTADSLDMRRLTEGDCRQGVAPFTTPDALPDTVRILRFQIALADGRGVSDALYLDALQLAVDGPAVADSFAWDRDGGPGWCLSADPGDGRGDWRHYLFDDRCSPCLEFSLLPAVEGDSVVDGDWRNTAAPGYGECFLEDVESVD